MTRDHWRPLPSATDSHGGLSVDDEVAVVVAVEEEVVVLRSAADMRWLNLPAGVRWRLRGERMMAAASSPWLLTPTAVAEPTRLLSRRLFSSSRTWLVWSYRAEPSPGIRLPSLWQSEASPWKRESFGWQPRPSSSLS